ncbi:hypothetical protein [Vibrio parahaemolyticus]|uniref:hypothetical protein n=1 Tax=Vibrio parahaemolyticus TaxID=670 RepID=UPI0005F11005|nr:hypothetical protein [Vibrio parahaemolyticus]KJR15229.1 hypothetical protein UF28_16315 [Vibrio parahaemolyticus]
MSIQRASYDIEIYRGDTPKFNYQLISVNQETGEETPVNITHHTITGQARRNSESSEVWFTLPIVKTDVTKGMFAWQLTKSDSENLLPVGASESDSAIYDIQVEVNNNVFTFMRGSFKVTRDITRG